jgi:hypothetical protein
LSRAFSPVDPGTLPAVVSARLASVPGTVRAGVDGPVWARPHELAHALIDPLRARGRPAAVICAETFWQDRSLRFEYGRDDPDARLSWLDAAALRRESLERIVSNGEYLPSLRDPVTNRSTRAVHQRAPAGTVLIVAGDFLLGRDLPFELTVHLAISPASRARHAAADEQWLLSAFDRYDERVRPADVADIVVRMDHPDRPAVRG